MQQNDQERLKKLVELRDSGVLTDEEYQSARARMVAAARRRREPEEAAEEPERASIFESYWPAFIGLGILILLIVGVVVYGSVVSDDETELTNTAAVEELDTNVLDAAAPGNAELCAASETYVRIKDMIFERAQQQYGGNPAPLDSLRKSVGVRMQYPLLRAVQQEIGRTDCGGHLVLDLPPPVRAAFEEAPALEADLEFSIQPAADGNGNVVEFTGADQIIGQLAVAAGVAGSRVTAPGAGQQPAGPTQNPSFDCNAAQSSVERIICQDEDLARLDRGVASHYRSLRGQVSPEDWQIIAEGQRDFLRRRGECTDAACVRDAYVSQRRFLERFGGEDDF